MFLATRFATGCVPVQAACLNWWVTGQVLASALMSPLLEPVQAPQGPHPCTCPAEQGALLLHDKNLGNTHGQIYLHLCIGKPTSYFCHEARSLSTYTVVFTVEEGFGCSLGVCRLQHKCQQISTHNSQTEAEKEVQSIRWPIWCSRCMNSLLRSSSPHNFFLL